MMLPCLKYFIFIDNDSSKNMYYNYNETDKMIHFVLIKFTVIKILKFGYFCND
jgi:hypothetical protein